MPPVGTQLRRRLPALLCLSVLSGLLLFLSDQPFDAWWLQLVALVPWLVGLSWLRPGLALGALSGFVLGACYTAGLLLALDFPLLLGGALGLYLSILWLLMGLVLSRVLRWSPLWAAAGAGAVAVLVEWLDVSLIPIWGSAQCFARVWSACPFAVQFVSATGMLGLVFFLAALQALVARLLIRFELRCALAAAGLVAAAAAADVALWVGPPSAAIGVAAVGWTSGHLPQGQQTPPATVIAERIGPGLAEALRSGAELVITPEVGLRVDAATRGPTRAALARLARRYGVWLAIGVWDAPKATNRIWFFDPRGKLRSSYVKTHLIYSLEDYTEGDGSIPILELGGLVLCGMICQDDNFTDLSRACGLAGADLVAVPTNDWAQVREYHLENAVFRAVESRYGIVRAASNGISAIVDARGRVLARMDHFARGPGVITARLPVFDRFSLYNHTGDWPMLGLGLVLLAAGWIRRRQADRGIHSG